MKLINIGFGNMVSANRLIAIVSPESAPIKRIVQEARDKGAHRRHLWTPHPCGHHHGFRPCDPFRRTARDGGEPSE